MPENQKRNRSVPLSKEKSLRSVVKRFISNFIKKMLAKIRKLFRRKKLPYDPALLLEKWKQKRERIDVLYLIRDDILSINFSFLPKDQRERMSLILLHKARLEHFGGNEELAYMYANKSFELDPQREKIEFSVSMTLDKLVSSFETEK